MTEKKHCLAVIVIALLICRPSYGQDSLIDYRIGDQFGETQMRSDLAGSPVIVIASDKDGSHYNAEWTSRLDSLAAALQIQDNLTFVGVATLSGVPSFLRSYVRRKIRKSLSDPVLLDWDAQFRDVYRLEQDSTNILVFDGEHRLVYKTAVTRFDKLEFDRVSGVIKSLTAD